MRRCQRALPPSIHLCHPGRPEGEPGTTADPKGLCLWLWSPDRRFAPSGVTGKGFRQLRSAYSSGRPSTALPIRDFYKILTIYLSHHKIWLTNIPVADMETVHRCTDADMSWHNKPGCTPVRPGFVLGSAVKRYTLWTPQFRPRSGDSAARTQRRRQVLRRGRPCMAPKSPLTPSLRSAPKGFPRRSPARRPGPVGAPLRASLPVRVPEGPFPGCRSAGLRIRRSAPRFPAAGSPEGSPAPDLDGRSRLAVPPSIRSRRSSSPAQALSARRLPTLPRHASLRLPIA